MLMILCFPSFNVNACLTGECVEIEIQEKMTKVKKICNVKDDLF